MIQASRLEIQHASQQPLLLPIPLSMLVNSTGQQELSASQSQPCHECSGSQDSLTYFILKTKKFKNCYNIPYLDGGTKCVSRKSCMKTSVKVRGTINKEPLLTGLLWERKGKIKEVLKTQGSWELF